MLAVLVVALGAMGFARDLHAASHAAKVVCAHDDADGAPVPSLPSETPKKPQDCPTCDLLAVLSHGAPSLAAPAVADAAPLILVAEASPRTVAAVAERVDANRTRGPPRGATVVA